MKIFGTRQADVLTGSDAAEELYGFGGADELRGKPGDDTLDSGDGDDTIWAGAGDDVLDGGRGHDTLRGGDGRDSIEGRRGRDLLIGGEDADILDGGAGHDRLYGQDGRDLLLDGAGADTLSGGAGADVFRFVRDGDRDTIADYGGRDRIDLSALRVGFDDLDIRILNSGRAEIRAAGERLVVHGARLDASDFAESRFILDPSTPDGFGLVGWAETQNGAAQSIAVDGDFAYVGEFGGDATFSIFDISDPAAPALRSWRYAGQEVDDIELVDGEVYLANDANGVVRVDVSDPDEPRFVEGRRDGAYAATFAVDDRGYGYAGYYYATGADLVVYDMSAFPAAPPVATYGAAGGYHVPNLEVVGDRAYLVAGDRAGTFFEIVDISDPEAPERVAALPTPVADYGEWVGDFVIDGDFAFLSRGGSPRAEGGLLVIDIADETAPRVAAFLAIADAGNIDFRGIGLDVVDGRAYLPSRTGLYVIDVTDPHDPRVLVDPGEEEAFRFPQAFSTSDGGHARVRGDYAYVTVHEDYRIADGDAGGLAVFRIAEDGDFL